MIALAGLCGVVLLALFVVAWRCLPSGPAEVAPRATIPAAPVRVELVREDHRTPEQRAADQARTNDAWGLR